MNARILLIDDDTRLTGMVRDYLQAAGLTVSVAGDLAQGRLKLQHEPCDVLVKTTRKQVRIHGAIVSGIPNFRLTRTQAAALVAAGDVTILEG